MQTEGRKAWVNWQVFMTAKANCMWIVRNVSAAATVEIETNERISQANLARAFAVEPVNNQ